MRKPSSSKRNKFSSSPSAKRPAGKFVKQSSSARNDKGPLKGDLYPRNLRAIVGAHAINEALATRARTIEMAWLRQGYESSQDLRELGEELTKLRIKIEIKPVGLLEKLAGNNQGAAIFSNETPVLNLQALQEKTQSRLLILDGIEDPHNLGAILRTAWLMKVDGIILPQDRSARLNSTVHKVACGGVEHVPVETVPSFGNILEELKKMDYWVFGLSHKSSKSLFDLKIPEKVVWVIGSEDKGLRTTTEKLCDELIQIPQANAAASYNASVATAIALTETFRQQK